MLVKLKATRGLVLDTVCPLRADEASFAEAAGAVPLARPRGGTPVNTAPAAEATGVASHLGERFYLLPVLPCISQKLR